VGHQCGKGSQEDAATGRGQAEKAWWVAQSTELKKVSQVNLQPSDLEYDACMSEVSEVLLKHKHTNTITA
jgi:hypothetical protein